MLGQKLNLQMTCNILPCDVLNIHEIQYFLRYSLCNYYTQIYAIMIQE
jgi:hypothetical protein